MIHFNCPNCNKAIRVRDEAAGKKGKCLGCGEMIRVPQATVFGDGLSTAEKSTEADAICPVSPNSTFIGVAEAVCPYCAQVLEKMPGRKKKCLACGNDIFVRIRPQDKVKILVREDQLLWVEEQWSIVNGTHSQFLAAQHHRKTVAESVNLVGHVDGDLDGVRDKLTHELADGLLKGNNPRDIARNIAKKIAGVGKKRALSIARTESNRALAQGQLDTMEQQDAKRLGVMVEWSTAGDERVCPLCGPLNGIVLTMDEAKGMIPRHESCRCCWTPANVGEDQSEQTRGKRAIESAINKSIMAEIPEGNNRTLAEQRQLSAWAGAKKQIAAKRPKARV